MAQIRELPNQLVVFRMSSNPKPHDPVRHIHPQCSIMEPDSRRPEPAHLFEMQ